MQSTDSTPSGTSPSGGAATADNRTPDEIQADIERTRERLGQTVEQLAVKTDVKAQARAKMTEMKATANAKATQLRDSDTTQKAAIPAGIAAGAGLLAATVLSIRKKRQKRRPRLLVVEAIEELRDAR